MYKAEFLNIKWYDSAETLFHFDGGLYTWVSAKYMK